MKNTDDAYIKLIANAIGEKEYNIDFSFVSVDRLMKLCASHKTIGLVWLGMSKVDDVLDVFRMIFDKGLKREVIEYTTKNDLLNRLSVKLSSSNIKHILIKGKTIAKYYPQEELRRLGDIDLLIKSKDRNDVKSLIEQMGGEHYPEKSDDHVDFYKLEKVSIEIHSKIVTGKKFSNDKIYDDFTDNAFENSQVMDGQLYELDFVTSLVYNVYHTAKHFYEGGCGVRMIADLWLMKNAANEENYEKVLNILDKMGLKKFGLKVFKIGDKWFGESLEEIENLSEIQNYIVTSGIYGNGNVSRDVSQIRKSKKDNYFINVIKWIFPSYRQMKDCCPWFENKPAVLLPIAYIVRGYSNVKERGGVLKTVKNIFQGKKENNNLNEMLKIMELYNE